MGVRYGISFTETAPVRSWAEPPFWQLQSLVSCVMDIDNGGLLSPFGDNGRCRSRDPGA